MWLKKSIRFNRTLQCFQYRKPSIKNVDSQRIPQKSPTALDSEFRQVKQTAASDLTEYSNQSDF